MYHMSAYKIIHKQTDVVLLHFTIISSLYNYWLWYRLLQGFINLKKVIFT